MGKIRFFVLTVVGLVAAFLGASLAPGTLFNRAVSLALCILLSFDSHACTGPWEMPDRVMAASRHAVENTVAPGKEQPQNQTINVSFNSLSNIREVSFPESGEGIFSFVTADGCPQSAKIRSQGDRYYAESAKISAKVNADCLAILARYDGDRVFIRNENDEKDRIAIEGISSKNWKIIYPDELDNREFKNINVRERKKLEKQLITCENQIRYCREQKKIADSIKTGWLHNAINNPIIVGLFRGGGLAIAGVISQGIGIPPEAVVGILTTAVLTARVVNAIYCFNTSGQVGGYEADFIRDIFYGGDEEALREAASSKQREAENKCEENSSDRTERI